MSKLAKACWNLLKVGGWAPLVVFAVHILIGRVLNAYDYWPPIDIPMHLAGGFAIAFFISRCFQTLPRKSVARSRLVVLELILVGSLTATAAMFWEFGEFMVDYLFAKNVQVGLVNTMRDMAMGVSGAAVFILLRALSLRAGIREFREVASDWVRGQAA